MGLGVSYKVNVDGQSGLSTLDMLSNKFDLLGNTAAGIGGKIKSALTFTAIEEAIRRTGEWAQGLEKTAVNLGTTNEKLQALQLLAKNANFDESTVIGFFETLKDKRTEAIKGNWDLIQSFQAYGVTFKDLQNLTNADVFSKVMSNKTIQQQTNGTPMGNAMDNLFGANSLNSVQRLQRSMGGMDLNQYTKNAADTGQIVKGENVEGISKQWAQVKNDLTMALQALTPLGKLLMAIATILSESLLGIATLVGSIVSGIKGVLTGNMDTIKSAVDNISGIFFNAVFGFAKSFTGLIDSASSILTKLLRHIPGLHKMADPVNYTALLQKGQDNYNNTMGSRNTIRGGEGLGALGAIIGTGGASSVARMGAKGALEIAGVAEKAGAMNISNAALKTAVALEKMGGKAGASSMLKTGISWAIGAKGANDQSTNQKTGEAGPSTDTPYHGITTYQNPTTFGGESQNQLKIGGVFGTGIQTRMIKLAQEQVDLLSQIVKNTSYLNQYRPVDNSPKPAGGN